MITYYPNRIILLIAATFALKIMSTPLALNDAYTIQMNTPIYMPVLINDLADAYPLDPTSLALVTPPNYGTAIIFGPGTILYTPFTGFTGPDSLTYSVADTNGDTAQATVYLTVINSNQSCAATCGCFDNVDQCLCTSHSLFTQFTRTVGTWFVSGNFVLTDPGAETFSFLQYNTAVDQTYEDLQVNLWFPAAQTVTSPFISAGLVTNWDGSNETNQKVAYISFDNSSGNPASSKLAIGGLGTSETIFLLPFQIQYNTLYTLRLIKNQQQTFAFINDTYIGTSNTGVSTGNYIGLFSYQATVQFNNLTSCSYGRPITAPSNIPFVPVSANDYPLFPPA